MTFKEQISEVVRLLQGSKRPIFIWGAGMRSCAPQALSLARSLGIPVACTWGAIDLIHHDHPLMCGGFGTHGTRASNFSIQNSDLVISIASRLDTKATGNPKDFARAARICMVDIDGAEIRKFEKLGRRIDVGICADAGEFIETIGKVEVGDRMAIPMIYWAEWAYQVREWRKRYDTPKVTWPGINPYEFVKELGKWTTKDDIIVSDTGTALGYLMQAFPFKGERFVHAFNMTPMGYGLPAAIGASLATSQRVVLVTGDGSLMMSLSELATVTRWNLNIKIILLNNGGHAMCRQTERQWFGGKHVSTDVESGLGFPDFPSVARANGIWCYSTYDHKDWSGLKTVLAQTFIDDGARMLQVHINPDAYLIPQARFGAPIEDQEPMLPREELKQQMIVDVL